jgi:hypothetical protein
MQEKLQRLYDVPTFIAQQQFILNPPSKKHFAKMVGVGAGMV